MKYSDYQELTKDQQSKLYDKYINNAANVISPYECSRDIELSKGFKKFIVDNNIKLGQVDNAIFQGMYSQCYFPHHSNGWKELSVDDDNIYNGSAKGGLYPDFKMNWEGCASSIYDGTLHLALTSNKGWIRGENEWGEFFISGYNLVQGVPPGGLRVHCERKFLNQPTEWMEKKF